MSTMKLQEEDIQRYHEQGFLVVENLLEEDFVDEFVAYEAQEKPEGWRSSLRNHAIDAKWRRKLKYDEFPEVLEYSSNLHT